MRKKSFTGLKFIFNLAFGLTGLCFGFFIATGFLRAVTVHTATLDLPLEDKRWVSFYDYERKEMIKVFVREQIPVRVSQIPTLLQRTIIQRKDPGFFRYQISLADLSSLFVGEFKRFFGLVEPSPYRRGISSTLGYNLFVINKKTLPHQFDEAILTYKIEHKYRKEEILEFYLNNIYFGDGAFGVEAAANYYFRKRAIQLKPEQIALMIWLATDTLSPDIYHKEHLLHGPKVAKTGRDQVLDEMAAAGLIAPGQAGAYKRKPVGLVTH